MTAMHKRFSAGATLGSLLKAKLGSTEPAGSAQSALRKRAHDLEKRLVELSGRLMRKSSAPPSRMRSGADEINAFVAARNRANRG